MVNLPSWALLGVWTALFWSMILFHRSTEMTWRRPCTVRGCAGGTSLSHCTHAAPHSACTQLPGAACGAVGPGCPAEGKAHAASCCRAGSPESPWNSAPSCAVLTLPGSQVPPMLLCHCPSSAGRGRKHNSTIPGLWHKGVLFFPCLKPYDNKLCVLIVTCQMQVFLQPLQQLWTSASLSP